MAEAPVAVRLVVVRGVRIPIQVERGGILCALHVVVILDTSADICAQLVRELQVGSEHARDHRRLPRSVRVAGELIQKAVLRDRGRRAARRGDDCVKEFRVVLDIREHLREVPIVRLRVVREIRARAHVRHAERLVERQLVLERGDRLRDVDVLTRRDEPVRRIERKRSAGRIEVIRVEELNGAPRRQTERRLSLGTGDEVAHGHRVRRNERVPLLMIVHHLRAVAEMPVVLQVEADIRGEPRRARAQPVVERQRQLPIGRGHLQAERFVRVHRSVCAEARDEGRVRRILEWQVEDELIPVIDDLGREAHVPIVEQARDVSLELSSPHAGEPGIADAMIVAIEAADVEAPLIAKRTVHVHIVSRESLGSTGRDHRSLHLIAPSLVDEIHDRARRVRSEQR